MSRKRHSQYLEEIFDPPLIVNAYEFCVPTNKAKQKSMVYVGTGLSGTAALFILLQAGLIERVGIVRKETEDTHGTFTVEMSHDIDSIKAPWIFVDDMIDTGKTFQRVLERMNCKKFHGALLYHGGFGKWRTKRSLLDRYGWEKNNGES